jgi:hypothetical protein
MDTTPVVIATSRHIDIATGEEHEGATIAAVRDGWTPAFDFDMAPHPGLGQCRSCRQTVAVIRDNRGQTLCQVCGDTVQVTR